VNAPDPINRYTRAVQLALQPLPVLPSMLRQRRECRIELHKELTRAIARRYALEAAQGAER
jgi:hypothetical protein